jgi:hypothetical protein
MNAKIYRFPTQYPNEPEGFLVYREGDGWTLRSHRHGRIIEIRGMTLKEVRDVHEMTAIVLKAFG